MIYHTAFALLPSKLAHVLAVILSDFGVLLIPAVGIPSLFTPAPQPASITAICLTAIARPADEKHHAATDLSTKQLSERHFLRHCPHSGGVDNDGFSWQPELHCPVRASARRPFKQKPRPFPRSGFLFLRRLFATLTSLRFAPAMTHLRTRRCQKNRAFRCALTFLKELLCSRRNRFVPERIALLHGELLPFKRYSSNRCGFSRDSGNSGGVP